MRRFLLLSCLLVFGLTAFAKKDPKGSYRWDRMPDAMRSNVLEQVATRRMGEWVAIVRSATTDLYHTRSIRFPVSDEWKRRLFYIGVEHWRVLCGIYPRFERPDVGWEGVLMYGRIAERRESRHRRWMHKIDLPTEWNLLCILDRAYEPRRELMSRGAWPQDRELCEDVWNLSTDDFLEKYGLREVFSNSVYRVREKCAMVVDSPTPEDVDVADYQRRNGVPGSEREEDRVHIARMKEDERGTIGNQHFLILSQEEASELVALVGRQWYKGDDAKYRDLRREYPWFLPVDVAHPQTQLGQELKATIERKEGARRK